MSNPIEELMLTLYENEIKENKKLKEKIEKLEEENRKLTDALIKIKTTA